MTEQQKKTAGVAVASLVLGISGFVLLGPLGAIPAVICGHVAKAKIRRDPDHLAGEGLALAGLILGYVQIALFPLLVALAIPAFVQMKQRAQVSGTQATLASVSRALGHYITETDRFPASLDSLLENDGSPGWRGPYFQGSLLDAWGNPLRYEVDAGHFSLISAGPDGTFATDDDIANR